MREYITLPKPSVGKVKVELDLSSHATKADLKNATGADTSKFVKKVDLANLKYDVDKLDDNKLVPVPTDLSKLSDLVKMMLLRKIYIMLLPKI